MASHLFLIFVLLSFLPSSFSFASPSPSEQASLLLSLKKSFRNPEPLLSSWNSSATASLCSWAGVQCDIAGDLVISLDLSNSNFSGTISPSIAGLRGLRLLSLAGNSLAGDLPAGIALLPRLRHLNISNNQLNGSLAGWNFAAVVDMEVFDAYDNNFFGSLPIEVVKLSKLRHLDLGGNYFSGSIPAAYGEFCMLEFLSLAGNDLGGRLPPELGNLASLKQLFLGYYNQFRGGIPPEIGNLINLTHLDLSSCGLDGRIPPELGKLQKLDTLFLQTNQFVGAIPAELGNLTGLKFLDLSNNALTSEIPNELSALRQLNLIHLFINRLHGEIPEFISRLPELQVLKLWHNNFTGVIPPELGSNSPLRELDLSSNKLTGEIPPALCAGRKLEILILLNNFLFGPLPEDLGRCKTLSRVRLGQNYLTGLIPRGLLYLPELSLMELQSNYLAGRISDEPWQNPGMLGQLNLSDNRLSGPLPPSFGNFLALQSLLLGRNQFAGVIPPQLGKLKHLLKIDLSFNNFSGEIPPEIGDCSQLTYLDLSQNKLAGAIPSTISRLRILNYLNVSSNQLSNSIPKEIDTMKSLTAADFSHNNISGRIPDSGQFAYFNFSSFAGNPLLCGIISNPCNFSKTTPYPSTQHGGGGIFRAQLPGRFKLLFALGLLACSVIFAATVALKTRSIIQKSSKSWRLTAFGKLNFSGGDVAECLKENCVIGRGAAGVVYRGTMPNGEQVAVKRLLGISKGSTHDNGLTAEIQTLGKIRHRNIVKLLAFCRNKETNLLVYEYMPNGSLGEMLHGKRGGYLKWEVRVRIATEAARGLCYLHHDCCPLILHRDVKSNNILLDQNFEAHVADFGLAKFLRDTGASECMSAIAGSYGYIAPEYAYTLNVDEKSDVYSFGVVLLELITGKRPVGDFEEEGLDIVQWAKMITNWNKDAVVRIWDKRLLNIPLEEAMHVFFVGMLCVQERSVERPTMREVVQMLEQAKQQYGG
ncbi:Leucine-rich repeat receptor-like serine/threonine-protein kinase BAM3 [Platanthera zijinensis]|uniref:non-specific serine/threonine protein kinase n=1 Tax=Platanthera zijinensis TaxID=2320716 RepID=A0AAP0GBM4_9ASPA